MMMICLRRRFLLRIPTVTTTTIISQNHCSNNNNNNNNNHYYQTIRRCLLSSTNSSFKNDNYYDNNNNNNNDEDDNNNETNNNNFGGPVTTKLQHLIKQGKIKSDNHQLDAAKELDRIYYDLLKSKPPPLILSSTTEEKKKAGAWSDSSSSSFFGNFFSSSSGGVGVGSNNGSKSTISSTSNNNNSSSIVGAYMYGGVGCGKTFLMNLLYDSIGDDDNDNNGENNNDDENQQHPWKNEKQKVHYHKFMLDVHKHMHESRHNNTESTGDLITPVVQQILKQGRFLCLDEFQVTDVADAMILKQLFEGLWDNGCVVIATSNRPPHDLYLNGLQRDRFVPFIHLLEQKCNVVSLMDSDTDYRTVIKEQEQQTQNNNSAALIDSEDGHILPVYYTKGQHLPYRELYYKIAGDFPSNPTKLTTQGRIVKIPSACPQRRLAKFSFEDLCCKALGAADYLVIGSQFSIVFVHDIPKLSIHHLNWLRRFITFVDTMYELKVTLVLHTHAKSIDEIFTLKGQDGNIKADYVTHHDEVFAFDRTYSRLEEMSSRQYILERNWLGDSGDGKKKEEDGTSVVQKFFTMDIPISAGEDYGGQLVRSSPPPLPTLRATPMNVNQID